jgi:hypothetical protein
MVKRIMAHLRNGDECLLFVSLRGVGIPAGGERKAQVNARFEHGNFSRRTLNRIGAAFTV